MSQGCSIVGAAAISCPAEVYRAIADAGLPPNALRVLFVEPDPQRIEARIRELLAGEDAPTGFVLGGLAVTEHVVSALHQLGADHDGTVEVVFYDHRNPRLEEVPLVHACSAMECREVLTAGVEALWEQCQGKPVGGGDRRLPVVLRVPPEVRGKSKGNRG